MLTLLLPLFAGICDRVRGGFPDDTLFTDPNTRLWKNRAREAIKFSYGAVLIAALGFSWWAIALGGFTWKFGEQLAGNFGKQFAIYTDGPGWPLAVLRVGALWPLLTIVALYYWYPIVWVLLPACIIGNLASIGLARVLNRMKALANWPVWLLDLRTGPAWHEFLRGALVCGLSMVLVSAVT